MGPIDGGLLADELHSDGTTEQKIFAPGYGEFYTSGGGDVEALALAVPTDAISEPVPPELTALSGGALDVFDTAGSGDWKAASATVRDMEAAWDTVRGDNVPRLIEPRMDEALRVLARTVRSRKATAARDAAIQAARSSFDLQLPYRPVAEIDLARMDLWAAQLLVDEAAGVAGGSAPTRSRSITFAIGSVRPWTPVTSPGSTRSSERSRSPWWTRISP